MPVSQRAGVRKGMPLYPLDDSRYLTCGLSIYFKDGGESVTLLPSHLVREHFSYSAHLLKRRIWLHPETSQPFVSIHGWFLPLHLAGSVVSSHPDPCYSPGLVPNITY